MKLVIDIPEGVFERVKRYYEQNQECYALCAYVANGVPLPQGHGDLIDRDDLLADSYYIDDWGGNEVNIVDVMTVKMADAIIEADKESDKKTEDNWLYETGREEPEILGSGSTYYNVVRTKDENEAMKLSKEAARTYLRRTQTENGVTITQEYSCQEGWINV